ncbi:hypothetical protein ABT120_56005 [Nonomuraea angiospora]|uniref:hypothetical protein n=1 Tax=Nonomuraea angiospora TaxID=46172 RepID=UPI0033171E6A
MSRLCAAADLFARRHRVHARPVGDRTAATSAGEDRDDPVPPDARGDVEAGRETTAAVRSS